MQIYTQHERCDDPVWGGVSHCTDTRLLHLKDVLFHCKETDQIYNLHHILL